MGAMPYTPICGSPTLTRPDVDLAALPGVAADLDGPTFHEPWQAQAFALVVRLAEGGAFSWREWTEALAGEIAAAGPDDRAELYYEHWLAALEKLADAKGLTDAGERRARRDAWERAARATPHGEAIVLTSATEIRAGSGTG
jgi:nitrile hydratase accessory protein